MNSPTNIPNRRQRRDACSEPLIFDLSSPGRTGASLPALDVPEAPLPQDFLRTAAELPLPESGRD